MKVLHIFNSINYSGAEIMYEAAAPIFIEHGFELMALSTGDEKGDFVDSFKKSGFSIFHLPYQKEYSLAFYAGFISHFYEFYKLLKYRKVDIVHIHKRHLFWMYSLVAKMVGIKKIVRTVHNVFTPPWYRYPGYFLARHFAKLIGVQITSISPSVEHHEQKWFWNQTIAIYNWYNEKEFYPKNDDEEKVSIREKLNIDLSSIVLITVGACLKKKNHKMVIESVSQLTACLGKKIQYLHVGTGPLEEAEKKYANKLDVENQVIFLGTTTSVRELLIAGDIFLMPSDYEGIGISAIEAMACKIPCIFFNVSGLKDLIPENSNNGLLIKANQESLNQSIIKLIKDPVKRVEISTNGKNFVKRNFKMKTQVKKFIQLYNEI